MSVMMEDNVVVQRLNTPHAIIFMPFSPLDIETNVVTMFRSSFNLARSNGNNPCERLISCARYYGTRGEFESPFKHLPKRKKKYFSWKASGLFFLLGSYLAYNETLFNYYEEMTDAGINDDLLLVKLEYRLKNLPIYQKLAHSKLNEKWIQLNSWENLDRNVLDNQEFERKTIKQEEYRTPSLHTHTLAQAGGIFIKPVIFHNVETNEGVTIIHAGHRLCGYPFIIHGGIIATFLNETFKRNASLSHLTKSDLKDDFKVENLSINYKYPTFANQFLVLKTKQKEGTSCNGKTIILECVIESQDGKTLVKSEAELHDTGRGTERLKANHSGLKKWIPI